MRPVGCLATVVVVLAGLAVAGDRVAEEIVENRLADEAEAEIGARPDVEIAGFPFLTQLVARRLGEVEVTAPAVAEQGVEVTDVRLLFRGVDVESQSQARVETAVGTGVVSFATLERAAAEAGIELSRVDGQIRAAGVVDVFGRDVDVSAVGSISATDNTIVFSPEKFSAEGVPPQVADAIAERVGAAWNVRVPVRALPAGVRLDSVRLVDEGVEVRLSGRNLVIGA
jgi:LmeA-like phospholipid-binding